MPNPYYNHAGFPANSSDGRAVDMRAELIAIQAAFDKLPALNSGEILVVNAAGEAIETYGQANVSPTTFLPVLTAVTPGNLVVAYSTQNGTVLKLGPIVIVTFEIITSTFTHTTASGDVVISGFPHSGSAFGTLAFRGITKASFTQFTPFLSGTTARIIASGSAQALANLLITEMPTAGTVHLKGSLIYQTTE